jgi:hypothetical protein
VEMTSGTPSRGSNGTSAEAFVGSGIDSVRTKSCLCGVRCELAKRQQESV